MKEITIKELVNILEDKIISAESTDTNGIDLSFSKAHIEYHESENTLSFVAGNYNTSNGIGSVSIHVDDIVQDIISEDDGSYTIRFRPDIADINIIEKDW